MLILYLNEYKCVFVVYSRCCSKSFMSFISKIKNIDIHVHSECSKNKDICLNTLLNTDMLDDYINNYNIYFILRNPYDRVLSSTIAHQLFNDKSYKEVIKTLPDNYFDIFKYYNESTAKLFNSKNLHIINFENFIPEINKVMNLHNIPYQFTFNKEINEYKDEEVDLNIKYYNNNLCNYIHKKPNYKYFYDQEIIDKIYNNLKYDFEFFKIPKNIDDLIPNNFIPHI